MKVLIYCAIKTRIPRNSSTTTKMIVMSLWTLLAYNGITHCAPKAAIGKCTEKHVPWLKVETKSKTSEESSNLSKERWSIWFPCKSTICCMSDQRKAQNVRSKMKKIRHHPPLGTWTQPPKKPMLVYVLFSALQKSFMSMVAWYCYSASSRNPEKRARCSGLASGES